jgi:PilZ domain-containing protein
MGKRSEPRKLVQVPVRIFGTDQQGRIFSETVTTLDVSRSGAKLKGVKAQLKVDEIIGLSCGLNRVHFRVKWVGQPGTGAEGQIGLLNLTPERPLWDFHLPLGLMDTFRPETRGERRQNPRVKCDVPVEIRPEGEANMWGKASDIGLGGCFVEMPIPLKPDTKFEIALWIGETKLRLKGEVASTAPGFGIGVRFVNVAAGEREFLGKHIDALAKELA